MPTASAFHHFDVAPLTDHKHPLSEAILRNHPSQWVSNAKLARKWLRLPVHMIIHHRRSFAPGLGRNLLGKSGLGDLRYGTIEEQP